MEIGLVDLIILIFIILGGIVGFKNGAIKEGTKFIGLIVILIVSFILKDQLMIMFYENMPFFNFFGVIKGLDAVNILFYQLLSFLIVFLALMFVLKVLIVITGLVEWLLKMTVFLSIPSKLLGLVVGAVEYYVYLFVVLYILNMPVFNLTFIEGSKIGNFMLKNTPVLSSMIDDTVKVYGDVFDIIKNRNDLSNKEVNTYVLATLLDNNLISIESARKLVESNKIIIEDISILDNYKENESFFEALGGCYLVDSCSNANDVGPISYYVTSSSDTFSYGDFTIELVSIGNETCVVSKNCNSGDMIEVVVMAGNLNGKNKYTLVTGKNYQKIDGTNISLRAKILDGSLVLDCLED